MPLSFKLAASSVLVLMPVLLVSPTPAAKKSKRPKKAHFNSYRGKTPPELVTQDTHWVNRKTGRLTLKELKGKTVWLQFNF